MIPHVTLGTVTISQRAIQNILVNVTGVVHSEGQLTVSTLHAAYKQNRLSWDNASRTSLKAKGEASVRDTGGTTSSQCVDCRRVKGETCKDAPQKATTREGMEKYA